MSANSQSKTGEQTGEQTGVKSGERDFVPRSALVPRLEALPMLTDKHCTNATCPADKKRTRFTDVLGLYLEVSPAESKRWFWKTYADGKEGRMALGSYPVGAA